MNDIKLDLMWTIFWVFCGHSFYTALVTFIRHDDKGSEVFKNLRIPLIVAIYFLTPCIAMYLVYEAFGEVRNWIFWGITLFVMPLSFFIMLYILVMPEWPVGKFLQIYRVPVKVIRYLLSINFAACVLIIALCILVLIKVPQAIKEEHGEKVTNLQADVDNAERDQNVRREEIKIIREEATTSVLKDYITLLAAVFGLVSGTLTFVVSNRNLNRDKYSDHKNEALPTNQRPGT
ncbi:MAG TPA: hypothetical protein VKB86_15195 [Pyrinomonadaceae bacterium]|nr:hypothetical protein [Pyrinomonadaceae bacterium]